MPIERLGPYRIERVLGRGGMGAVYAAVHEETGERVAVKVLAETLADDANFRERFSTEVETLKTLKHPHIVELFGYGEHDGLLFYAMELIEGNSLQDELQEGHAFDWREVIRIGIQVCGALKHAHDHGVIHRDLKPANLMYTAEKQVKLSDFGIAKLFGGTQVTAIGGVIGTADYMSPEQAEGKLVTARTDLYSLGTVLYALLARQPPFASQSIAAVIHGLRFDKPEPIRRWVPEVPPELENVIMQLLEKDPQKRIATARAVGNRLKAMEHALSLETRVDMSDPDLVLEESGNVSPNLDDTIVPQSPVPTGRTQPSFGDQATAVFENLAASSKLDLSPTRPDDVASQPLDLDDLNLAPPEQAVRSPVGIRNRFTQVTEDERRHIPRLLATGENREGTWIKVLSITGMIVLLLSFFAIAWQLMQPETADQLYERIMVAASNEDIDALIGVERSIEQFMSRFPTDPRQPEIAELQKDLDIYRMQRRLELRARRVGGADYLSPAEQAFLAAMRVRRNSVELARARLEHLVNVFGQQPDASKSTQELVELAQHQLERLRDPSEAPAADHREELDKLVAWANAELSGEARKKFHQGVVALYAEKPWAAEVVAQSRAELEQVEP